jgi:hypothetical protein
MTGLLIALGTSAFLFGILAGIALAALVNGRWQA